MTTETDLSAYAEQRALATRQYDEAGFAALERLLGDGDLFQLSNQERVGHYLRLCRRLGLNELSRPFDWIAFKESETAPERLTLYANQSCAAQLRRQHHMRLEITRREVVGDLFVCEVTATTPDGRVDVASKYVPLVGQYGPLKGQRLANAMMKAETGAKRRVTLSMVGLASGPDREDVSSWRTVIIDGVGRVVANPTDADALLASRPEIARAIGEPVFEDVPIEDADDAPSQVAHAEEIARAMRPAGERPSFKRSPADVTRLQKQFMAMVHGSSLQADDARHALLEQWTADIWPANKRTDSLMTFLRRATEDEAQELLAHVETLVAAERRDLLEDVARARETDETADVSDEEAPW